MPASNHNAATVRQVSKILDHTQSYLEGLWICPREGIYLDRIVLTLLSKSLALSRSTVLLVRSRFDEEAFGVSRTLLELALNLRYITNGRNPELRAKRYVHYVAKIEMDWGKLAVQYFKYSTDRVRQDMPNYKVFQSIQRKFPKRSWIQTSKKHAKGIWTMAMEEDRFEKVPILDKKGNPILNKRGKPKMRPFDWAFDYQVMYFWESQFVHVTVDSLDNHAAIPGKPFLIYTPARSLRRKTNFGDMALFNVVTTMQKILLAGFRGIDHPYPEQLSKPIEALMLRMAKRQ